jgi:hypothetical protein
VDCIGQSFSFFQLLSSIAAIFESTIFLFFV